MSSQWKSEIRIKDICNDKSIKLSGSKSKANKEIQITMQAKHPHYRHTICYHKASLLSITLSLN